MAPTSKIYCYVRGVSYSNNNFIRVWKIWVHEKTCQKIIDVLLKNIKLEKYKFSIIETTTDIK